MEGQNKLSSESQIKIKIKEFIEETNELFETKSKQINTLINSIKTDHEQLLSKSKYIKIFFWLLFINIVLSFCEKNNLGVDPSPDTSSSNISVKTSKKTEKNYSIGKNVKSSQKAKDSLKNSYYSKYLNIEESNRSKINNKNNNTLRQ